MTYWDDDELDDLGDNPYRGPYNPPATVEWASIVAVAHQLQRPLRTIRNWAAREVIRSRRTKAGIEVNLDDAIRENGLRANGTPQCEGGICLPGHGVICANHTDVLT